MLNFVSAEQNICAIKRAPEAKPMERRKFFGASLDQSFGSLLSLSLSL